MPNEPRQHPAEPRPVPDDQIHVPAPPDRYGPRRHRRSKPPLKSYRLNTIRTRALPTLSGEQFDVAPNPGFSSQPPSKLFGDRIVVAHYLAGVNAFGGYANRENNQTSYRHLTQALRQFEWQPAVAFPKKRGWVEQGAFVLNAHEDEVLALAAEHGQEVVLRWDATGLTPLFSRTGEPIDDEDPTPVAVEPAMIGCPLRKGVDDWCRNTGFWSTSRALRASTAFETHRRLLIDALGCTVCLGAYSGKQKSTPSDAWFEPTREGGWADNVPFAKPDADS